MFTRRFAALSLLALAVATLPFGASVAYAQTDDRIGDLQKRIAEKGDFQIWDMEVQSKHPVRASEVVARVLARREAERAFARRQEGKPAPRRAYPRDKSGAPVLQR